MTTIFRKDWRNSLMTPLYPRLSRSKASLAQHPRLTVTSRMCHCRFVASSVSQSGKSTNRQLCVGADPRGTESARTCWSWGWLGEN
nr:putative integron gene cassette protein [uncultured bacterium]